MDLKILNKNLIIICILVFILGLFARIYTITLKEDFHQDEALSIILANYSEDGWTKLPDTDIEFTGKEIKQKMFWNDKTLKDTLSDIGNLYLYTRDDSHSNLYYTSLRLAFNGVDKFNAKQTIYRGCAINLIAYCLAFFFMFKILALLFKNSNLVPFGLFVAFLNTASISASAYLKPYALQETAFIIVTYYFILLIRKEIINPIKPALAIAFSFLTGYYSLIYVGILAIILFAKNLDKKYLLKIAGLSILATTIFYPGYFLGIISYRATETVDRFLNLGSNLFYTAVNLPLIYFKFLFSLSIIFVLIFMIFFIKKNNLKISDTNLSIIPKLFFIGLIWSAIILFIAPYKILRYILPIFPIMALIIPYIVSYFDKKIASITLICSIMLLNLYIAIEFHKNPNLGKYIPVISKLEFIRNSKTKDFLFKENLSQPVYLLKQEKDLSIGEVIEFSDIITHLDDNQKYIFINPNTVINSKQFYLLVPKFPKDNFFILAEPYYNNYKRLKIQDSSTYFSCIEFKH